MTGSILGPIEPEQRRQARMAIEHFVREGLLRGLNESRGGQVRFLQIGGHDGRMGDPLLSWHAAHPWTGAIVEPVPIYFAALEELHRAGSRIRTVPCAVSDREGTLDLWHVAPHAAARYPAWTSGIASTDRGHLERHGIGPGDCACVTVPCVTPATLIERMGSPEALDLLVLDVEGHELPIIRGFPVDRVDVAVIMLEAWHLSQSERAELRDWSARTGRRLFILGEDAVLVREGDALRAGFLAEMQRLLDAL
ncbi:MAG TPA: FkbM family methyltransferase [Acetobacteraceae bacterium]|nr:FkbM family methyltransferase [Acetobacteraceae bacterium]